MAERKATNKYYPPDWDPSKGSINTFVGQHPLRDRARKLDQGILIIRFEMPFSIWCEGCENHVGKRSGYSKEKKKEVLKCLLQWKSKLGVRYNAEKKKVGMYYSTPIWQFRMKCHLCNNWIEIHTDPKNAVYEIKGGARKREEEFSPEDNETMALKDDKEAERLLDPMYKLEQTNRDIQKAKESSTSVSNLLEYNERLWKDPFTMSQKIRQKFRTEKKVREAEKKESNAIRDKHQLLLDILPNTEEDELISKTVDFGSKPDPKNQLKNAILSKSIFSQSRSGGGGGSGGKTGAMARKMGSSARVEKESVGGTLVQAESDLKHVLSNAKRMGADPFAVTSFVETTKSSKRGNTDTDATSRKRQDVKEANQAVGLVQYVSTDDESE